MILLPFNETIIADVGGDLDSANPTGGGGGGETFTITGIGFGSHGLDIEFLGGADGHLRTAPLGVDSSFDSWSVDTTFNPDKVIVDNANRGHSWELDYTGESGTLNGKVTFDYGASIPEGTDVVMGYWAYIRTDETLGQWKMLRVQAVNSVVDQGGEVVLFNWTAGSGKQLILRPDDSLGGNDISGFGAKYPGNDGTWTFIELILKSSTEGVANGDIKQTRHIEGAVYEKADLTSYFPANSTMTYGESLRWRYFTFQNYMGNGFGSADDPLRVGMSDQYIQVGTTKRVFLTDNATFALSTWREIQKPLTWSDTTVTGTLNHANRAAGNYYIHIVEGVDTVLASQAQVLA